MKNNYNLIDIGIITRFKNGFVTSVSSLTRSNSKKVSWAMVLMMLLSFTVVQRVHATTCPAATVINPTSLPVINGTIICGTGNDISGTNLASTANSGGINTNYLGGQESVYSFTPNASGLYVVNTNSPGGWLQIAVFNGCPTTAGTVCVGAVASSAATNSISLNLTAGVTYFVMFDTWPSPNSPCPGTFSLFQLVPNTTTSIANGGLWSSAATWGGAMPNTLSKVVIPAGSIVTVDQAVVIDTLIIDGILQWGTSNTLTANVILIKQTGRFLPYTTAAGGTTGVTVNVGNSFTNNGYANLAVGTSTQTLLNFNGANALLTGTGVFEGDGTRGIIRQLTFQTLGTNTISTTQDLTTYILNHNASTLNTNGKLRIDNTAQIFGQAINTQVANIAVTNMGSLYSTAPVVFGASVLPKPLSGSLTSGTRYFSGNNVYLCTTAGAISVINPAAGWGLTNTTTFTDSLATLLWIGNIGTIGNPFITTALTVGTQYFYGNNLYTAVLTTAPGTVPPTHTSGVVGSFLYVGTPARVTVNYDATTQTVRSLNLVNAGNGYSSATAPSLTFNNGAIGATGSGAAATPVILYAINGPANSLAQRSTSATITGGLSINSDQGASLASSNIQASSGVGALFTTNGGINYTSVPQVGISGPTALNLVTNAGSGYTTAPTITVSGGTQPAGATPLATGNFTITVNQGRVVSVYLTGTAAYLTPPTLTITGGGGSGATLAFPAGCWATATPVLGTNGQIRSFTITNPGFGYVVAPTCAMATAPTGTTAATAPTARVALYNLTYGQYSPSTAAMAVNPTEDVFIPVNRKINTLNLQATGNGLNLTNDLILYGTSPFALSASSLTPGNVINLGTKNITCSWNGYAGTTGTFGTTRSFITNGSMTLIGRGGGNTGSTYNFPFSGTVTWFSGTGTSVANGSTILTVKVSDLGAPSNANATGTAIPIGNRAFRVETASTLGAAPIGGTNPTVRLNFNAQDNLTVNQNVLFLADGAALNGPWNLRSIVYGATATALPATGNLITAGTTTPPGNGPITVTGNDFYAWSSRASIITNVTPLSMCASSGAFTLKGTGLLGVSAVTIAGAPVNSFTVVADTMITGIVGAGTTGIATVTKFGSTYSGSQTITLTGSPVAPTVTPTAATIILGDSPSFTASGTTTGTYAWYTTFTGGTAIATTATYVTAPVCQSTNLYVAINDGTCEGARATVPITVNPMPTLSSTTPTFCGTGGTTTLSLAPSYTGLNYSWQSLTTSATISTSTGTSTVATINETSDFKLKVTNNGCADSSYISIGVYPLPLATVTTTASGVCPGTSATIGSGLSAGNFTSVSITPVLRTAPSNAVVICNAGVGTPPPSSAFGVSYDDGGWANIPIGFNFNFFGTTYSTINAGTNGNVMFGTFNPGALADFTFTTLPSTTEPLNMIALLAMDNNLAGLDGGKIQYWTEGYAPNRKFVISYENVKEFGDTKYSTFQGILYETLGVIDVVVGSSTNVDRNKVTGVNNGNGTVGVLAYASGTSASATNPISTSFAFRFSPPSNYNTIWTATDLTGTTTLANATNVFSQTVAPAVTTTYNISYTDLTTGCTNAPNSAQVQMIVLGTVAPANVNAVAADSSVCWGSPTLISLDYTGLLDGLTFQWQESTNGGTTWTNITGATANSYTAAPQTPSMYRCYIASCNGVADTTSACTVALNNFTTCYCISAASSATDEEIFNVSIGSLNNTSDCSVIAPGTSSLLNRYSNYTNGTNAPTAPSIEKCLPIPFSVTVGACSQFSGGTGLAVFIDLNQNGLFTDAGEKVYSNGSTANIMSVPSTIVNGNITIPSSALNGTTRMRVMSVWNSSGNAINPCMTYTWGETEDYLIDILPLANCPTINGLTVSNITNNEATLSWNVGCNTSTDYDIVMTGTNGSNVFLNNINPTIVGGVGTYTLTSLDQTTTYTFDLRADCGVDSSNALNATFTTFSNCNNPFGLSLTNGTDSIFGAWQWQSWDPALYQVSGFNLEYGMLGFTPTTGTVYLADANFTDTILDQNLLAGGVYQVYVQAICSNGDTSGYSSPITITMPVDNDTVCGAEMLSLNTDYIFNNTGATVSVDEINIAPPATGAQTTDGWINSTLNRTTWFKFVAPNTGSVRINSTSTNYDGQSAVYDVALCSDFNNNFNLIAANDNAIGGTSLAPNYTVCGLTPGNTYYIMHDGFTATAGNYAIKITEIILEAGASNPVSDICYGDTINLYTTINSNDLGGSWSAPLASSNASIYNDSLFTSTGLAYQTFNFQYRVVDGCAYDSIISQVKIFAPSNAGQDGIINACRNEPIDLLSGLTVNADFGGNWFDPSNNAIPSSQITTGNFGGASFNYDYIVGNGVCPDDTANVVVNVGTCNWLDITEETFAGVEVYPNPTNGVVFVTASMNAGNFSYEVTDANGRIIAEAINGVTAAATTSIDLSKVEIGVYFITLSNVNAKKVYRIVVQ